MLKLKKRKGSFFLTEMMLFCIVLSISAGALLSLYSGSFKNLEAVKTQTQALQFAEVKASELRVTSYNDLDSKAQARAAIPSTNFEREVVIGAETDIGGGNKQKIATVNIYRPGEAQPRFFLPVPLSSQGSNTGVPVGTVIWSAISTPPSGFLVCDGSILSSATYPALVAALGTTYGAYGQLPDLRGEFIRGLDKGRGVDSGRLFGSVQGDAIRNITGTTGNTAEYMYGTGTGALLTSPVWGNRTHGVTGGNYSIISFDASRVVPTANENRPRNIALLPCIKY